VTDHVEIGTAVVAYIEPHAGLARDFNRWYERDHFYAAAMAGPGAFTGGRWVATRECKALRPPDAGLFGDPTTGSYLATYFLLPGMQAQWEAWTAEQVQTLTAAGRMFAGRDHLHTAVYRLDGETTADGDAPPAALALDHGFRGVAAFAIDRHDEVDAWMEQLVSPAIPVATRFTQERLIMSVLGDAAVTDPDSHALVLAFFDGDVLATWRAQVEPALAGVDVKFASPFLRTIPGTDTYTDQL
jgi:hypothetical protein